MSYRTRNDDSMGKIVILVVIFVVLGVVAMAKHSARGSAVVTINDKESVNRGESGHQYRVYTDKGTFRIADSLLEGKFASADLYGSLKEGERYRIEYYGWRMPLVSAMPNIVKAELVTE